MELSFIINAVRRRLWLVVLLTLLGGGMAKSMTSSDTSGLYHSRAVLNVSPPSQSRVAVSFSSDPDRYVIGQLSVLGSAQLAERIATKLGNGETTESVQASVDIEHQPSTDIVLVTGSATTAERAQDIADEYVLTYIEELRQQVDDAQQPDIDQLNAELKETTDRITLIDQQITDAMAPFVNAAPNAAAGYRPIPTPDQVVPNLVTQRQTLLQEYTRLSDTLKELELDAKLRVTSFIVQRATLPTATETSSGGKFLTAAGAIGGAMAGLVIAVIWARLSRKVLDAQHVEEILFDRPVAGTFPRLRGAARGKRAVLESLPGRVVPFVDQLCVRAEANAGLDRALTVAVVGTERASAATTIALAMAGRFGANGSSVVLVDADVRHPEISTLYNAGGGIPALLANAEADAAAAQNGGRLSRRNRLEPFTSTPLSEVTVLGLGDKAAGTSLRRQNVRDLLDVTATDPNVHVVVLDAGPVLDAASTVEICQLADAVVLAVPLKYQTTDALQAVAAQLGSRQARLLTVVTKPHRPVLAGRLSRSAPSSGMRVAGNPIIDQVVEPDGVRSDGRDRSGARPDVAETVAESKEDVETAPDRHNGSYTPAETTWDEDQRAADVALAPEEPAAPAYDQRPQPGVVKASSRSSRARSRKQANRKVPPISADRDPVADATIDVPGEADPYSTGPRRSSQN